MCVTSEYLKKENVDTRAAVASFLPGAGIFMDLSLLFLFLFLLLLRRGAGITVKVCSGGGRCFHPVAVMCNTVNKPEHHRRRSQKLPHARSCLNHTNGNALCGKVVGIVINDPR